MPAPAVPSPVPPRLPRRGAGRILQADMISRFTYAWSEEPAEASPHLESRL